MNTNNRRKNYLQLYKLMRYFIKPNSLFRPPCIINWCSNKMNLLCDSEKYSDLTN